MKHFSYLFIFSLILSNFALRGMDGAGGSKASPVVKRLRLSGHDDQSSHERVQRVINLIEQNDFETIKKEFGSWLKDIEKIFLWAVVKGYLPLVRYLREQKEVNPNLTNDYSDTAIFVAIRWSNSLPTVRYLIEECGVDINQRDRRESTILHIAAICGRLDVVEYLVKKQKMNPNQTDDNGATPLIYAAQQDHLPVIRYLVEECHVDVNYEDNNGGTALNKAADFLHLSSVRYLIEACNVSISDNLLKMMQSYSRWRGPDAKEVYRYLRKHALSTEIVHIINKAIEEKTECPVCLEKITQNHADVAPCCLNVYCENDIAILRARGDRCALCRGNLE